MADIAPTPYVDPTAAIARTDAIDLTVPVAGTIALQIRCGYPWKGTDGPPYPFNYTTNIGFIEVVVDGAVTAVAFDGVINYEWQALTPTVTVSRPGSKFQLDFTIDTTLLANGAHFVYLSAYSYDTDTQAYPIAQIKIAFTVAHASPPSYSGNVSLVNPYAPGAYPHFAKDGSILTAYASGKSVLPLVIYPTGFGGPAPSDLTAINLTQVSVGFFSNPNDGAGWRATDLATWKTAQAASYAAKIAGFSGVLILHTGDDICNLPPEKEFIANCPWAYDAITYAASLLPSNALMIAMVDEVDLKLGPTPVPTSTPSFYTGTWSGYSYTLPLNVVALIRAAVLAGNPRIKMTWPNSGSYPSTEAPVSAAWGAATVSDWLNPYTTTLDQRAAYGFTVSLFSYANTLSQVYSAVFAVTPRTYPIIAITPMASQDPSSLLYTSPQQAAASLLYNILNQGMCGARIYAWDPSYPNWAAVKAAVTVICGWLVANVQHVLQPMLAPPNYGPWISTSLRDGGTSTVLTIMNLSDVDQPMHLDLSAIFGPSKAIAKSLLAVDGVTIALIAAGADVFFLGPNQAAVYIFSKTAVPVSSVPVIRQPDGVPHVRPPAKFDRPGWSISDLTP